MRQEQSRHQVSWLEVGLTGLHVTTMRLITRQGFAPGRECRRRGRSLGRCGGRALGRGGNQNGSPASGAFSSLTGHGFLDAERFPAPSALYFDCHLRSLFYIAGQPSYPQRNAPVTLLGGDCESSRISPCCQTADDLQTDRAYQSIIYCRPDSWRGPPSRGGEIELTAGMRRGYCDAGAFHRTSRNSAPGISPLSRWARRCAGSTTRHARRMRNTDTSAAAASW